MKRGERIDRRGNKRTNETEESNGRAGRYITGGKLHDVSGDIFTKVDPIRTIYSATPRVEARRYVYIKSALQMFKHGTRERACYREILCFYYGVGVSFDILERICNVTVKCMLGASHAISNARNARYSTRVPPSPWKFYPRREAKSLSKVSQIL